MSSNDHKKISLTLIDIQKFSDHGFCYYADDNNQVYFGGSNHPKIGFCAGVTLDDIGKTFSISLGFLVRKKQDFENGKFVYEDE